MGTTASRNCAIVASQSRAAAAAGSPTGILAHVRTPGGPTGPAQPLLRVSRPPSTPCLCPSLIRSNRRGTDPYARLCGRGGAVRRPPITINRQIESQDNSDLTPQILQCLIHNSSISDPDQWLADSSRATMVTVALALSSSCAIGLPKRLEWPMTTAWSPDKSPPWTRRTKTIASDGVPGTRPVFEAPVATLPA